jgi:hypothetical protein
MRALASSALLMLLVSAATAHAEEGAAWQRYLHSQLDNIADPFDPDANFRTTVDTATETSIGGSQEIEDSTARSQEADDLAGQMATKGVQDPLAGSATFAVGYIRRNVTSSAGRWPTLASRSKRRCGK